MVWGKRSCAPPGIEKKGRREANISMQEGEEENPFFSGVSVSNILRAGKKGTFSLLEKRGCGDRQKREKKILVAKQSKGERGGGKEFVSSTKSRL